MAPDEGRTSCRFACSRHESHFTAIRKQSTSVPVFMESSLNAKANSRQRRRVVFNARKPTERPPRERASEKHGSHHPSINYSFIAAWLSLLWKYVEQKWVVNKPRGKTTQYLQPDWNLTKTHHEDFSYQAREANGRWADYRLHCDQQQQVGSADNPSNQ